MTTSTTNEDIDTIVGDPSVLHLEKADVDVIVQKLRTREFFKLLKILTVGAGPALSTIKVSPDSSPAELTQDLLALLALSIPEAEEEVMDFLKAMIAPQGLIEPERSKTDRQANVEKYTELYRNFDNPDIEDTVDLLVKIITDEMPNMLSLGKRLAALLPSAAKPTTSSKPRSKKPTPTTS